MIRLPSPGDEIDYLDKDEFYTQIKKPGVYEDYDNRLPEYWDMIYGDRAKTIKLYAKGNILLDVGCGSGRALMRLVGHGFDAYGVEPSQTAISRSVGLQSRITRGLWPGCITHKQYYNVVYIEQVLSHTPDISQMLKGAWDILAPNGIIVIEEPNDFSYLQKAVVDAGLNKPEYWKCRDHVNYGSYKFWMDRLERAGFRCLEMQGTWPMEWFALSGDNYFGNDALGKTCHEKRYKILSSMTFSKRQELGQSFAKIGIGRDILIYAQKVSLP